jgi:hypothetical protein
MTYMLIKCNNLKCEIDCDCDCDCNVVYPYPSSSLSLLSSAAHKNEGTFNLNWFLSFLSKEKRRRKDEKDLNVKLSEMCEGKLQMN